MVGVTTGAETLRRVAAGAPDIVLLDLGADDYVNKPFGIGELLARMRVALRHGPGAPPEAATIVLGDVTIDVPAHRVTRAGDEVRLTPKEFDLLVVLARPPGRVLTHRHLLAAVWGPAHVEDTQYPRVFVAQLRAKLEADPSNPALILTEPGIGYRAAEAG